MFSSRLRLNRSCVVALLLGAAALACNLSFSADPSTQSPDRPSLLFIAPENQSVIAEGATLQIAVNVRDPGGAGAARVEFNIDEVPLGQSAPKASGQKDVTAFQVWTANGVQAHLITARAYRADNSPIGEAALTVNVVALPTTPVGAPSTAVSNPPTVAATALVAPTAIPITPSPSPNLPTTQPQPSAAPTTPLPPGGPQAKVTYQFLNVRSGPGTNYTYIGQLKQGDMVTIIGRNADRSWWVIQGPQLRGWIINNPSFIAVTGNLANVPLAAAPPSPIPTIAQPTSIPPLIPTSTPNP